MYIPKLHKIWLCQNDKGGIYMYPKMANRHGLIAGATGTGKTVTLKVLAESFSEMGVPVFLADIKGDVSGMCLPGEDSEGFRKRLRNKLGLETEWKFAGYPVRFWDVYGKGGIPVRATVSEMGPDLLSRLLELNETQSGVMNIVFRVADDQGLLLLDCKDLRSMVQYVGDNAAQFKTSSRQHRCYPTLFITSGGPGCRYFLWRTGTRYQGLVCYSRRRPRCYQPAACH